MKLEKIKGNTYYINAPTNIGIFLFKNKNCLLIDSGINTGAAKKIEETICDYNIRPKYIINTHGHRDHFGGNTYFRENYLGTHIYASAGEKLFMENPDFQSSILFGSYPLGRLKRGTPPSQVDFVLEPGIIKINDEKFEVISLKGHSTDQIGIITPEKVCFLGDAIFSEEIISKYFLPYVYNLSDFIETLNNIKNITADYFVLGHNTKVLSKEEISELADRNLSNINNITNQLLELLEQPQSREEILESFSTLNELDMGYRQYHLNLSSISAFIAYLYDKNLIEGIIEGGRLYYFRKPI